MTDAAAPGSTWRPLLEVLRAPLLLSPIADVLAGWCLGRLGSQGAPVDLPPLLTACAAGCCLLAAGMAQNALADRDDDRRRKPDRPLPRGAVHVSQVRLLFAALTASALVLGWLLPRLLPWIGAIVALSALYHYALKQHRVAGCLALGTLRALDMGLGVVAAAPQAAASPLSWPVVVCIAYGLYITGASLHASTDDEPGPAPWSARGLALALGVLLLGALGAVVLALGAPLALVSLGLLLLSIGRLGAARRKKPPPAVTGVALSNLYLTGAAVAFAAAVPLAGALVVLLFGASRILLRVFPPS